AVVVLAACSTTPIDRATAQQVPPDHIYAAALVGTAGGAEGDVLFLRDEGFVGRGCSHDIFVDNRKAFAIRAGEKITLHVPAGLHVFRLETGAGLCPNIAMSQETTVGIGAHQVFRILLPSDGSLRLTRVE